MLKEQFNIKSDFDQLPLGTSIYIPEQPRAILQLVHGMSEHRQRYHELMEFFVQNNYIVIIHDHRGHGESIQQSQDLGFMYTNQTAAIIEDTHQITVYVKKRFPNLPLILLGHSMGSLVVRSYIQKYDHEIDGLIVCGSPSYNPQAKLGLILIKFLKAFKGARYQSLMIQKLMFGSYNKDITNPTSPNSWLCTDSDVVKDYDQDPACGFVFSLSSFEVLLKLLQQTYKTTNWQVLKPELPVLFIAGDKDPCIISQTAFAAAVQQIKDHGYHNCNAKLYANMRHEILNENGKQQVWEEILAWCNQQIEPIKH